MLRATYDVALESAALDDAIEAMRVYSRASAVLLVMGHEVRAVAGTSADEPSRVESRLRRGVHPGDTYRVEECQTRSGETIGLLRRAPQGGETRPLAPVLPHLARALGVRDEAQRGAAVASDVAAAFAERISVGVIHVRDDLSVVKSNLAARELMTGNRVLYVVDGRLVCQSRDASRRIADAIRRGDHPVTLLAEEAASGDTLALLLRRAHPTGWLLLAHDPERPPRMRPDYLIERYRLTPREARLAIGIAYGGNLATLAKRFEVTTGTLRSQLKSVFRKICVDSQAQLIATLLSDPFILFDREGEQES